MIKLLKQFGFRNAKDTGLKAGANARPLKRRSPALAGLGTSGFFFGLRMVGVEKLGYVVFRVARPEQFGGMPVRLSGPANSALF
jgi:hypothetical protein